MSMTNWLKKYWPILAILLVFFVFRLPAINQIYHQDEYRWAMQADPRFDEVSPHPPLSKQFLSLVGTVLGFEHLRFGPLFFGFLTLLLLYFMVKKLSGSKGAALVAASLYSLNVYSVIANLQIDIDGAILPFFVLLGYCAYINLKNNARSKIWWLVFVLAVAGGFLTKLSFAIFIGAIVLDFIWSGEAQVLLKKYFKLIVGVLIIVISAAYLYVKLQSGVITYAEHFNILNFASRAYFELAFKILKSFVWLSPLLLLPIIVGLFDKEIFRRNRPWFIYLGLNIIFYTVLFDFARLTVERYFMFWILPAVIISSDWVHNVFKDFKLKHHARTIILSVVGFAVLSFVILSLNPTVLPLDPKTEYVRYVRSLNFNFLIPFTGGSGPVGFYFSALYVLVIWAICLVWLFGSYLNKKIKPLFVILFLVFSIGYNILFLNEYLFGSIYGSVPNVAKESVDYVLNNPDISSVITYYDTGAYYLRLGNKYSARFYTAITRDYTERLSTYKGYYMIVDFPAIDKRGRYWPYLERCNTVKKFNDKKIDAYILNCG